MKHLYVLLGSCNGFQQAGESGRWKLRCSNIFGIWIASMLNMLQDRGPELLI